MCLAPQLQLLSALQLSTFVARMVLFPRAFAVGSETKAYSSFSWDSTRFDQALEPEDPSYRTSVNSFDLEKAFWPKPRKNQKLTSLKYNCVPLVDRPLTPGPLLVASRGKGLVIAAGHVRTFKLFMDTTHISQHLACSHIQLRA